MDATHYTHIQHATHTAGTAVGIAVPTENRANETEPSHSSHSSHSTEDTRVPAASVASPQKAQKAEEGTEHERADASAANVGDADGDDLAQKRKKQHRFTADRKSWERTKKERADVAKVRRLCAVSLPPTSHCDLVHSIPLPPPPILLVPRCQHSTGIARTNWVLPWYM